MSRALVFLKRLLMTCLVLAVFGAILYAVQVLFGVFNPLLDALSADLTKIDQALARQLVTGLSIGTIALVLFILFFPLLMKGVEKKQYLISVQRGIISSVVFMLTEWVYHLAEQISRLYLFVAVGIAMFFTVILIEFISLAIRKENEVAFRTDMLAAIVSGLVFGVLVKMTSVGWEILKLKVF